jgi:hypothetical protein
MDGRGTESATILFALLKYADALSLTQLVVMDGRFVELTGRRSEINEAKRFGRLEKRQGFR